MGKYKITCYCSACNSPPQSRETKSGHKATAGTTVAVHPDKYVKDKVIRIDGIGERKIQDIHGNRTNVIDVYIGERRTCHCSFHQWSRKTCEVEGM